MSTQTINPERAWAEGMTQMEFSEAYRFKYGQVDTIPFVDEWIYGQESKYKTITLPHPDHYVDDYQESLTSVNKERVKAEKKAGYFCKGCGKESTHKIGVIAHQNHCKLYLNMR